MLKNLIAIILAVAVGAIGYSFWVRKDAEESPLVVMVTQMRTRAIIEHERNVTVWYKACPEVAGINPQVMVIWPAKLNYELDLAETKLSLGADGILHVKTPAIRGDDPVLFLEHKKMYRAIKGPVPLGECVVPIGSARVVQEGTDATVIAYGMMVHEAQRAIAAVAEEAGASIELVDLRSLKPLHEECLIQSAL